MATFGKLTNGTGETTSSTDRKKVSSASPSSSGTAASITIRGRVTVENTVIKGVIYADSAGAPGARLAVSDEITVNSTTEQEWTGNFSGANQISITNGTTYWIGWIQQDPGTGAFAISRDATGSQSQTNTDTYSDGPSDPFGTPTAESGPVDVYVTYTTGTTAPAGNATGTGTAQQAHVVAGTGQAHRLYLTNDTAPTTAITPSTVWDITADAVKRHAAVDPAGSATTVSTSETSATTVEGLLGQFVSAPITAAGTLGGTFYLTAGVLESDAAANFVDAIVVRVIASDNTTVRGTALASAGSLEWPTTATAQGLFGDLTDVSCQVGDRIVIELGFQAQNTSTTSRTGTLNYGGTATLDLEPSDTDFSRSGWIDLPAAHLFAGVVAPAGGATGTGASSTPSVAISPPAGHASGSGSTFDAAVAASQPAPAELGTGTGTASDPRAGVAPPAGHAAGAGAALDPAVATSQPAPAEAAEGTGTAHDPATDVGARAGHPSGAATALGATVVTSQPAPAEAAGGTGTAFDSAVAVTSPAGNAAGAGTAFDSAVATSQPAPAGLASGTGEAFVAAVQTDVDTTVQPGLAAAAGTAFDPVVATSQPAGAELASGAAAAHDATVTTAAPASAEPAGGAGAAHAPAVEAQTVAEAQGATGAAAAHGAAIDAQTVAQGAPAAAMGGAHDPSVATAISAQASTGTGDAHSPAVAIGATSEHASGIGVAGAPAVPLGVPSEHAIATGAAGAPTLSIVTPADHAAGTGAAHDAVTTRASVAQPELAAAAGVAHDAAAITASEAICAAGHATGVGNAHDPTVLTVSQQRATGWRSLFAVLRSRLEVEPEAACPNDGTPYRNGPDGQPFCPFDGYRPHGRAPIQHDEQRDWGGLVDVLDRELVLVGDRTDDPPGWG